LLGEGVVEVVAGTVGVPSTAFLFRVPAAAAAESLDEKTPAQAEDLLIAAEEPEAIGVVNSEGSILIDSVSKWHMDCKSLFSNTRVSYSITKDKIENRSHALSDISTFP
jgi:hypothetical protein